MSNTAGTQKFRIKWLCAEITRRCNYKCIHCMRGDAQNLTITPEIIDTMFSQLYQLDNISIIGGETLLELEAFHYFVESLDKYNLQTKTLYLVTNGSILNPKFVDILSGYVKKGKDRLVEVLISNDDFHDKVQSEKAYQYYNSLEYDRNHIQIRKANAQYSLVPMGRARAYINENIHSLKERGIGAYYPDDSIRNHQICIKGTEIECWLSLFANGLVGLMNSTDYSTQDKMAFGNIINEPLETIIQKHNDSCFYLCDECYNEVMRKTIANYGGQFKQTTPFLQEKNKVDSEIILKRIEFAWTIRKLVRQKLRQLPIRSIIHEIPVPSYEEWQSFVDELLSSSIGKSKAANVYLRSYQRKFPDATIESLMELSTNKYILYLLEKMPTDKVIKLFFGQDSIYDTELFKKLLLMEQDYLLGRKPVYEDINVCELTFAKLRNKEIELIPLSV